MRLFEAALCGFSVVLAAGAASPANLPREIQVETTAPYSHEPTKIALPTKLGTLSRGRIAALDVGDLDVMVDYRSPDNLEVTTIYLYRNAVGDVPLWFDRAAAVIERNPAKYGRVTHALPIAPFIPPGQTSPSALRVTYATEGKDWTTTSLAIIPVGDFYVKLRLSSATLTAQQLDARLSHTLSAISWPSQIPAAPAAVPMTECKTALAFKRNAKPAPNDGAAALIGALMPTMADALEQSGGRKAAAVRYCRDPGPMENAGLYRPNGEKQRYLIAIQDAGRAVHVGRNDLTSLVAKEGRGKPRYSVELILLSENQGFGEFESLPTPEQSMRLLNSSKPLYSTSTIGKKNSITIDPRALGDE